MWPWPFLNRIWLRFILGLHFACSFDSIELNSMRIYLVLWSLTLIMKHGHYAHADNFHKRNQLFEYLYQREEKIHMHAQHIQMNKLFTSLPLADSLGCDSFKANDEQLNKIIERNTFSPMKIKKKWNKLKMVLCVFVAAVVVAVVCALLQTFKTISIWFTTCLFYELRCRIHAICVSAHSPIMISGFSHFYRIFHNN